jgi:Mg2+-importing ATPase
MDLPFWNEPIGRLFAELRAGPQGLTGSEASRRLLQYGPNDAAAVRRAPAWLRLLARFHNPLVAILLVASALSAATGDVSSFVIVVVIVTFSVLLDFFQEMHAENAIDALREQAAVRAIVVRDRQETNIPVRQIVPGDVVHLAAGDLVPADGRLVAAKDFFVNQALLTGESYPVEKHAAEDAGQSAELAQAANVALAGTSVISGNATFLVCRTGQATILGKLAHSLVAKPPPTAFEAGLHRFSMLILRITILLVIVVLTESIMFHRPALESLMFALALAVGLTPELLPMIVTVTLSRGAVRLARRRVVVKRPPAIHNLGAMDVLCTDKTGTLTEAHITLMRHIDASGAESDRVFELAYLNSAFETGLKSPLDAAILEHGKFNVSSWRKLDEVPFDFGRRRVSVLVERDGKRLLIVKGAPEDVLRLSASVEATGGGSTPLTPQLRVDLADRFEQLGIQGLRALGIATREVASGHTTAAVTDETELAFAGFAMFLDPPKASAADAIKALAEDGVAIKVLTGDNDRVASHVCGSLGIAADGLISGDELASMSDEALIGRLPNVSVFCRVTPEQKLRVLMALKRMGQTVGFLGDGINDAPALHAADVGISVDGAADVAKAAADIVLLDKDLAVLHAGVVEGRRTVVNVGKYILMASSANFGNIMSMAVAGLFLPFLPLLPIQVLLTNLLYDAAQTALPFDRVDRDAIERPVHWNIRLIERFMLVMGPVSTLFDLFTFAVLIFIFQADETLFRTGWFVESLVTQLLMVFAVRTRHSLFASRPYALVGVLALGISAVTIALPFSTIGAWFRFAPPPAAYFGFLVLAVIGFLAAIEVAKRAFYTLFTGNAPARAERKAAH